MAFKFLIDNALSQYVLEKLREKGYDLVYLREKGLQKSNDLEIFELAYKEGRIIIYSDTDFSFFLYKFNREKPSIIIFRQGYHKPAKQVEVILKLVPLLEKELKRREDNSFRKRKNKKITNIKIIGGTL